MRTILACFLLVVATVLAGCAGGGAGAKDVRTGPLASAPEPVANESRASLAGTVVSEELVPISGVVVALRETAASVTSDPHGRFTFNDLDAGTYTLVTQALGYDSRAMKVTTTLEQVTYVNITLSAVKLAEEAIITSTSLVAFVDFGHAWTDYYVAWGKGATCTKCVLYVGVVPTPNDARFEASWVKPVDVPVVSEEIYYLLKKGWQNGSVEFQDGTSLVSGYWIHGDMPRNMEPNDNATMFADKKMKDVERIKIWIGGGFTSVAYQQKIDMWISFVYNGEFPDPFSAFPPPA